MARRVSWTNNSTGHTGTYVYRAPTLDPQNLPAPVATVDPVAQGATAEWIDNFTGYECYAVQDFDGQGAGTLSAEVCVDEPDPFNGVAIGDEVEGGIYAGIDTIGGVNYHIICGDAASENTNIEWKTSATSTAGTQSTTDGLANTLAMESAGLANHPAAGYCLGYGGGGFTDWHMPARSQLQLLYDNLAGHPTFAENISTYSLRFTWSSTENTETSAWGLRFSGGLSGNVFKPEETRMTRPIRRVPV